MDTSSYQMLHEVIENNGDHDTGKRGEREGGEDQSCAVIVHAESVHEGDTFSGIQLKETTEPVRGGKGNHAETDGDSERDREKIPIVVRDGLGQRNRRVGI